MSIFFRYVLKSTLLACLAAVLLFSGVLIAGNAVRDIFEWIASGRLSFFESVKILSIVVPSVISYSLPLGLFAGILISVSRLSSSNELLTMKSTGLSIYKISVPIFLIATVATVLSCIINLWYAPDSITKYRNSFKEILHENPIRFIQSKEFVDWFPGYIIYVDSIDNDDLLNLRIWQMSNIPSKVSCYISAKSGKISYDHGTETIMMTLFDGNTEYFTDKKPEESTQQTSRLMFFNELSISLPITGILGENRQPVKKLRHMNIHELLYARNHYQLNNSEVLTSEILKKNRALVDMQISSDIAMAFGVFAMSLLAIPLGVKKNRADTSINVLLALALAFLYYFTMIFLSWFGNCSSIHPEVLIWLPNVVLLTVGIKMLRKVAQN